MARPHYNAKNTEARADGSTKAPAPYAAGRIDSGFTLTI